MPATTLNREAIVSTLQSHLPSLRATYGVRSLALFGSYARNEQCESSDVDLLVEFDEVPGLFGFVRLERELSELLGAHVDLVMRDALKPRIRHRILHEMTTI